MIGTEQIVEFLHDKFELPLSTKISLVRSYTNDVYRVDIVNHKYLLKIYGKNWRTEEELYFEVDLLNFLKLNDIKVAGPTKGNDGKYVYAIDQDRFAILFEWADGDKPIPPFSPIDRERLGKAAAKIHLVTDLFKSGHYRKELGIDYLIRDSLTVILDGCNDEAQKVFFVDTARSLERYLEEFISKGLDFGIVHADVTFDNVHVTNENEVIFYDFDSGGQGWRAIDLQGWAVFDPKNVSKQNEFISGYRTVRNINDNDIKASSYLHTANEFWGISLDLTRRILNKGEQAIKDYLANKEIEMRNYMEYFASHQI